MKNWQKAADFQLTCQTPAALVFDNFKAYINDGGNNMKVYEIEYLNHSRITDKLEFYSVREREGYGFLRFEDGFALYLPEDVMMDDTESIRDEDYLRVSIDEALDYNPMKIAGFVKRKPFFVNDELALIYPRSAISDAQVELYSANMYFLAKDHVKTFNDMTKILSDMNADKSGLFDVAADAERARSLTVIVNVFAYGFIILISLIALTNVFNTVSTNIFLRRRELAMFKSIGMTRGGFNKMMNYECIICGARGTYAGASRFGACNISDIRYYGSGLFFSLLYPVVQYSYCRVQRVCGRFCRDAVFNE